MYINQLEKALQDKTAQLDRAVAKREQAQARLDEAAKKGGNIAAQAAELVAAQAEEKAMSQALDSVKRQMANAEKALQSSDYKKARKSAEDLQREIKQDADELIDALAKTGTIAIGILNKQRRLRDLAKDFETVMTEQEGAKLQSSKPGNMAFYVLSVLRGLFQDLSFNRPEIADRLPKV